MTRPAASLAEGPAATSARAKDMVVVVDDAMDDGGPLCALLKTMSEAPGHLNAIERCRALPAVGPTNQKASICYVVFRLFWRWTR